MVSQGGNGLTGTSSKLRNNLNHVKHQYNISDHPLHHFAWKVFLVAYCFLNWCVLLVIAVATGGFFERPTERENNETAIARDAFWNLSKQPLPGFHHNFFKTRSGFQFHYLSNKQENAVDKDLIIFIHGFPNTCMTWRYVLQEPALLTNDPTILAVDLPGYGGTDSLPRYDSEVLEHLTEFVVAMREKHGTSGDSVGSTFIVAHDWGCVISMRLAAEAPSLADRFILTNGPLSELGKANIERSVSSAQRIFKQFRMSPRDNFGCLAKSFHAIKPLLKQLWLSKYILAFQLPSPFVKPLGEGGNLVFLRTCYELEHRSSEDEFKLHVSKAANLGPGLEEYKTQTKEGAQYGSSVAQRAQSAGNHFWEITSYYRDGLALDPWEKSIESIAALHNIDTELSSSDSPSRRRSSSASSALFDNQIKGCLRAPATILWGEQDLALSKAICVDGIGDYLAKDSEVILLANAGHWFPIEREPRKILAQVIGMFARGDSKQTPSYVAKEVQELDAGASLMVKR